MTYRELLRDGAAYLEKYGIEEAQTDAWLLLSFTAGFDRTKYLMMQGDEIDEKHEKAYVQALERRAAHTPLQHITGEQNFMGFDFKVTKDVLVPRQDTEVLAELALEAAKDWKRSLKESAAEGHAKLRILDMCTGSGCLAVSLKLLAQNAEVTASDYSEEALAVAKENAEKLGATIDFRQGDLFENVEGSFDIIVSNPPYIPTQEIDELTEEVKNHDPMSALDGGEDGLVFYRRICEEGRKYLSKNGKLLFEIGAPQGADVSAIMKRCGFEDIKVTKDLAGLDRVVSGVYTGV